MTNYIAYRRTSTGSQHNGLEAQEIAMEAFISSQGGNIIQTFTEQVSGRKADRDELQKAIKACKKHGASLLVSKLDRLSRRVSFIALLMESSIQLKVCEHPEADTFMLHLRAILSEEEARQISSRTKAALAVLKSKGVKLGNPKAQEQRGVAENFAKQIAPTFKKLQAQGITSLYAIAKSLNEEGIKTFTGGKWHPNTVKRTLGYLS